MGGYQITEGDVTQFLQMFKYYAQDLAKFTIVELPKNRAFNTQYGITYRDNIEIINSLTYLNYSEGPLQDAEYPGNELWVFGYHYNDSVEIYIKLSDYHDEGIAKCISLHEAKYQMQYPFCEN